MPVKLFHAPFLVGAVLERRDGLVQLLHLAAAKSKPRAGEVIQAGVFMWNEASDPRISNAVSVVLSGTSACVLKAIEDQF